MHNRQGPLMALMSLLALTVVIVAVVWHVIYQVQFIGPVVLLLGFVPWIPIVLSGRSIRSTGADIIFGAVDTGLMAAAALIGAELAGILGAIVGGLIGDSITNSLAGIFEGSTSERLRSHGIEEARTAVSASMGKLSGSLIGAGITLTVAWTIAGLRLP